MARKSAKKSAVVENVEVIETVTAVIEEKEVQEMEINETVENVEVVETVTAEEVAPVTVEEVAPVEAVETAENVVAGADVDTEAETQTQTETEADAEANADADEETEAEAEPVKKERAKINTNPFPVAEIVRDRLAQFLPNIIAGLGDKENASELAEAKLYNAGLQIAVDLVDKLEIKFINYAPRSYEGKNPSAHWTLWKNTRADAKKEQDKYKSKLAKIYAVTDAVCYDLIDNENWAVSKNAKYSIDNFLPNYTVKESCNIKEQVKALSEMGVKTIDYVINYNNVSNTVLTELLTSGYMLAGIVSIEERAFEGFGKFSAVSGVYRFTKN